MLSILDLRTFLIMDFIFLVGSIMAMRDLVLKQSEIRLLGVTLLVLYIIMHIGPTQAQDPAAYPTEAVWPIRPKGMK